MTTIERLAQQLSATIETHKECYVAQWILQNPDKNIGDYSLTYRNNYDSVVFSIEEKV